MRFITWDGSQVQRSPVSGWVRTQWPSSLFVNPGFTIGIDGIDHDEAMSLLNRLYDHAGQEQFTCRFEWKPGSVAFWDNRAVWHYALNDYPGHRREMHRITLDGCELAAASI